MKTTLCSNLYCYGNWVWGACNMWDATLPFTAISPGRRCSGALVKRFVQWKNWKICFQTFSWLNAMSHLLIWCKNCRNIKSSLARTQMVTKRGKIFAIPMWELEHMRASPWALNSDEWMGIQWRWDIIIHKQTREGKVIASHDCPFLCVCWSMCLSMSPSLCLLFDTCVFNYGKGLGGVYWNT